ncbi:MAG: hypothetical protein WBX29_00450, partial [Nitrososphaeraceae archaeon]
LCVSCFKLAYFLSKIYTSLFPFQVLRLASYLLAGATTQIESKHNNSNRLFLYTLILSEGARKVEEPMVDITLYYNMPL